MTMLRVRRSSLLEPASTASWCDPSAPLAGDGYHASPSTAVDDELTVLTYELLGDAIHAFVARRGTLDHRPLDASASAVRASLRELDDQLGYFELGPEFSARNSPAMSAMVQTTLQDLYAQLVAPIEDLISTTAPSGRICVVPSGFLHRIPFHALHDGASYLVDRWPVTLGPSATIAQRSGSDPAHPSTVAHRTALVFGLSDPTIPHATAEARRVAAMFDDVRVFVDGDATTANLRAHAPHAGVIHLACHGLHRTENPLFSSLRLADGWINSAEIMTLPLRGATVVLSACESGRQAAGAEPLGLSWAFLAAGASAVIVSLWAVQDDVAADVMTSFYTHLLAGASHAHALRSAQRETARRWAHPYHWAPFALVGPFDPSLLRRSP
jgi:CHAT domain-containing protein